MSGRHRARIVVVGLGLSLIALGLAACKSGGPKRPSGGIPEGDYSYLGERLSFEAEKHLKEDKLASLAIAVVDGEKVVFSKAFGFADVDRATAAETTTFYRQGSVTKLITGIAVMQLVDEGKIDLDAPLAKYLPDFKLGPPPQTLLFEAKWSLDDITVRSILTHHSGLPGDLYKGLFGKHAYRHDEVVGLLQDQSAASPAGILHAYSNLGYALLGALIEKVSGQPYAAYAKEHVLAPCGIDDADFERTRPIKPRLAQSHLNKKSVDMPGIGNLSAGGLFATLEEMTRFAQMLLARGEGAKGRVLPAARLEEMWARQNEKVALDFDLEQGLTFIRDFPHVEGAAFSVGHNGATPYQRSSLAILPEEGLGVVVLTNSYEGGAAVAELTHLALELALETKRGVEPQGRAPAPQDGPALDEEQRAKLKGVWDTGIGTMFVSEGGKKLFARVLGQKFELRPTKSGTVRLYIELFGFVPLLIDELQRTELAVEEIDGRAVLVATQDEKRSLFGTRLEPRPLPESWKGRTGTYEYVELEDDPLFPKFEVVEREGVLCFKLTVKDAPGQILMLAIQPIDDGRGYVAGLGRNRGDQVLFATDSDGAQTLSVYGYTLRKSPNN